jgi:O-antigen/teichoic acid export membrane protein
MKLSYNNKQAKNFLLYMASQFICKGISFFTIFYLARHLSVEFYGKYVYINTIISYLLLAVNFGFDIYFAKKVVNNEISLDRALSIQILSRVITFLLILIISILIILSYYLYGKELEKTSLFLFFILVFKVLLFSIDIFWLYRINELFMKIAGVEIFSYILRLFAILTFISNDRDVIKLAIIDVILDFILKVYLIKPYIKNFRLFSFNVKDVFYTIKESILISLSYFMINIYYNLDSLMLGYFKGSYTVGIYSAAYNFNLLAIVPTNILFQVYLKELAQYKDSKYMYYKYIKHTMLLSIIIFISLFVLSKYLILITYGEKYLESIPVLKLLSFNVLSSYAAGAFANPINVWGYHKDYLFIVSMGALTNFIGNLIFIPKYGITAAIATTIISEIVVFILAFFWSIRHFNIIEGRNHAKQ